MLSERLVRTEYVPKPSKVVPLAKVTEKITMTLDDETVDSKRSKPARRSLKQDVLQWKLNFPDEQGKTKPRAAKLKIEEEELYSRYTNFGKSYLYDYEDDDVIGVKKDFKVFAGYIDCTSNALLSDLNMRKFYKLQDHADCEPFDEESMNQECDFLEDTRGGSPCRIVDCPEMAMDTEIDGISADSSGNTTTNTTEQPSTDESHNSTMDTTQNSSLANASHSTELDSSGGLDLSSRVIPQMMIKSKVNLKVEPELKLNILGLPEKMLRKRAMFALPKEMTKKQPANKPATETEGAADGVSLSLNPDFECESGIIMGTKRPAPAKLFFNLSMDLRNIPTPPPSEVDEEDFVGFDETPEFNDSDVFTSTLARLSLDSSLFLPKVSRSMSQDSGFQSPPASLRFSCDDAGPSRFSCDDAEPSRLSCDDSGPSDVDSGLGASGIDSELATGPREKTNEADFVKPPHVEAGEEESELQAALTEKHKKLQDQAEKRHQERLDANVDVTVEVNKWHAYLKPILKASHARANFDIHELGTEILNSYPGERQVNQTITFADVVAEKEQPDICRYFLSTLLLANTENIRLSVTRREKDQVTEYKDMQMAFLSAERHYQEINEMYDTEGMLNTNVKKRMRENDEELAGVALERTPKKKQKQQKMLLKTAIENSPADSGYLSGLEEGSMSLPSSPSSRKRSSSGAVKINGKVVVTVLKGF